MIINNEMINSKWKYLLKKLEPLIKMLVRQLKQLHYKFQRDENLSNQNNVQYFGVVNQNDESCPKKHF